MPMRLARVIAAVLALGTMLPPSMAAADQFPSRTISLVVPLTPGTTIDILARLYADKLSQILGQPVVVMNKPGAGGIIGGEAVAGAAADGYTLLFANSGHSILGFLNKSLQFDPIHDFAAVSMVGLAPAIVVVPRALGVSNLKEFIALAKAKPGTINYGSAGIGTSTHLAGAYFAAQTKTVLVHVPYTVSSNVISDMLSGAIQASFDPLAFVLSFLQNGSLRGLAVAAEEPINTSVQIPSAISEGIDYRYATWYGILAPAKTPKTVLKILADAMVKVSEDPDLQQKIRAQGILPKNITLDAFDSYVDNDVERLEPLIENIGIKQEN
jgi:tripartite-type tricarboxylate transporter receptor subunit TctC